MNVAGANERLHVGIVYMGVGCNPGFHLHGRHIQANSAQNNIAVGGICDLFKPNRKMAKQFLNLTDSEVFEDYRYLLERKDIDAVIIATHDPLHAPAEQIGAPP